jgi:hypothetical protein
MARRKQKETGLGDVVEKAIKATKLDKLVGDDCGCDERKKKLNSLLSWGKPIINCIEPKQAEYVNSINNRITLNDRIKLAEIYQHVYGIKIDSSSTCGDCWAQHLKSLKRAIE